ncbi:MAG: prepilin peptidase [Candidatus Dojkabacteria bacterium]
MIIILIILLAYLSSTLSKFFLIHIENKKINKNLDFILIPFLYRFSKQKAGLKFSNATIGITELSSIFFGFVLSFGLNIVLLSNEISITEKFILIVLYIFIYTSLLYLSVYDIIHLSIPENFLKVILLVIVIINLLFGLYKFISFRIDGSIPFPFITLGTIQNIIAGFILGGIIFIIHKSSHEKAIGEGDIYIMMIIGYTLGITFGLISFFLTCVLGSLVGISYSLLVRKFKGVLIPFVPLILLGFVFTLAIGTQLLNFITLNY